MLILLIEGGFQNLAKHAYIIARSLIRMMVSFAKLENPSSLGKGSKIRLIIFAEFAAKGYPTFAENN